jgi:hypothetical protein
MSVFAAADASVEDPLLEELEAHRDENVTALTVPQVLAARELRKPLAIVCFAMLSQQLSGTYFCLTFSFASLILPQELTQVNNP